MSYEQRLQVEKASGWWKYDELHELPLLVKRCSFWKDVEKALDHVLEISNSLE
jgi:hypothetical protein